MDVFIVEFDNGLDRRATTTLQADTLAAADFGQREAHDVFARPWNGVADQRRWKIVVIGPDLTRYEEPVARRFSAETAA